MADLTEAPELEAAAPVSHDDENRLTEEFVRLVSDAVDDGDANLAQELVNPLHNADIADLFELIGRDERAPLASALGDLVSADVLSEMNEHVRDDLLGVLNAGQIADLTEQLDTDDAVSIIEDLDKDEQQAVLAELEPEDRAAIESALTYPEETAGRIMQRNLVAVPEHMTVGQLIDYLREHNDLTTEFWEVYVVDPAYRPVGTCQLSWILRVPRDIAVADIMKREQTLIPVDMDQEEVAIRFQKYNLISAAVVNEDGRLIGMITVDDILHIIEEEASEDVLLLSGAGEGDINEPIRDSYKARVRWLIANLATAMVVSMVIAIFGAAIEKMVALAILMPIVASIGGNAGTQTMAISVRALAMNELTRSNTKRIIGREFRVALLNGGTIAVLVGLGTKAGYDCPLTQSQLSDALGLSSVHINRVFRQLREDGLLTFRDGKVVFDDFDGLVKLAEFDLTYLDQDGPLLR